MQKEQTGFIKLTFIHLGAADTQKHLHTMMMIIGDAALTSAPQNEPTIIPVESSNCVKMADSQV